ncbi:hypothetical protein ACIBHX_36690 [Nonomuraea sp. NPDC050536]
MTRNPALPITIASGRTGRILGSVAVPDKKSYPREAACRKDVTRY